MELTFFDKNSDFSFNWFLRPVSKLVYFNYLIQFRQVEKFGRSYFSVKFFTSLSTQFCLQLVCLDSLGRIN